MTRREATFVNNQGWRTSIWLKAPDVLKKTLVHRHCGNHHQRHLLSVSLVCWHFSQRSTDVTWFVAIQLTMEAFCFWPAAVSTAVLYVISLIPAVCGTCRVKLSNTTTVHNLQRMSITETARQRLVFPTNGFVCHIPNVCPKGVVLFFLHPIQIFFLVRANNGGTTRSNMYPFTPSIQTTHSWIIQRSIFTQVPSLVKVKYIMVKNSMCMFMPFITFQFSPIVRMR